MNTPTSFRSTRPDNFYFGLLIDPKVKLSGTARRRLMRLREKVTVPKTQKKEVGIKMLHVFNRLPIAKLRRRIHQYARRAATAKYLLAALSENSQFRAPLEAEQTLNLSLYKQAVAEAKARLLAVQGRLAAIEEENTPKPVMIPAETLSAIEAELGAKLFNNDGSPKIL